MPRPLFLLLLICAALSPLNPACAQNAQTEQAEVKPEPPKSVDIAFTDKLSLQRLLLELFEKRATVAIQTGGTAIRGEITGMNSDLIVLQHRPDRFTAETVYIPVNRIEAVFLSKSSGE